MQSIAVMRLHPRQRAAAFLVLTNLGFVFLTSALWTLALRAPTAVVIALVVLGGAFAIAANGWVVDRSTADSDAIAALGWPPTRLRTLRVLQWTTFGLFMLGVVELLATH